MRGASDFVPCLVKHNTSIMSRPLRCAVCDHLLCIVCEKTARLHCCTDRFFCSSDCWIGHCCSDDDEPERPIKLLRPTTTCRVVFRLLDCLLLIPPNVTHKMVVGGRYKMGKSCFFTCNGKPTVRTVVAPGRRDKVYSFPCGKMEIDWDKTKHWFEQPAFSNYLLDYNPFPLAERIILGGRKVPEKVMELGRRWALGTNNAHYVHTVTGPRGYPHFCYSLDGDGESLATIAIPEELHLTKYSCEKCWKGDAKWTPSTHNQQSQLVKRQIMTILLVRHKLEVDIPRDVWYYIIELFVERQGLTYVLCEEDTPQVLCASPVWSPTKLRWFNPFTNSAMKETAFLASHDRDSVIPTRVAFVCSLLEQQNEIVGIEDEEWEYLTAHGIE